MIALVFKKHDKKLKLLQGHFCQSFNSLWLRLLYFVFNLDLWLKDNRRR